MKNKNLYFLIFILFLNSACALNKNSDRLLKNDQSISSTPKAKRASEEKVKIAHELIKKNGHNLMIKKMLNYQRAYYSKVNYDLNDLLLKTSNNLRGKDLKNARKTAILRMREDADLMDEVKNYVGNLDNETENSSYIRFSYTRTPFILRKAADLLADDNYFNCIVLGISPNKFKWNELTFLGGIENVDDKGTVAISALTASMLYLLDDAERSRNLYNHDSIIYNESISEVLSDNPALLHKIQKNYYLFSPKDNMVSKVYEGYEFGGNKDLEPITKYAPLDCSTGISMILGLNKNPFFTGHLASYHDEFFEENSTYWKASDWTVRREIIKNLKPTKITNLHKIKVGSIIVWRNLKSEKALKNPQGYVGNGGHIAIVIGVNGDDLYSISWARNLEYEDKGGLGIDINSISKTWREIQDKNLILFGYDIKQPKSKQKLDS